MNRGPETDTWLSMLQHMLADSTVQNWLVGIGSGALFALVQQAGPWWSRPIWAAILLMCLVGNFPRLLRVVPAAMHLLIAWANALGRIALVLVFGMIAAWTFDRLLRYREEIPAEVRAARKQMVEVENYLATAELKRWLAAEEPDGASGRIYTKDFETIAFRDLRDYGDVLGAYLKGGKMIAEDTRVSTGNVAYSRKYYDENGCNFATDFFDESRRYVYLTYDHGCIGQLQIRDVQPATFPFPIPLPVLIYR